MPLPLLLFIASKEEQSLISINFHSCYMYMCILVPVHSQLDEYTPPPDWRGQLKGVAYSIMQSARNTKYVCRVIVKMYISDHCAVKLTWLKVGALVSICQ